MDQKQWDSLPEPVQKRWLEETAIGAPTEELKRILRWCIFADTVESMPSTQRKQ